MQNIISDDKEYDLHRQHFPFQCLSIKVCGEKSCFSPKIFVYFNKYLLFHAYHEEVLVVDIISHVYSSIEFTHTE